MQVHVRLDRYFLGLHGLAFLRGWPFEDESLAHARRRAMHALLHGEGDEVAFDERDIDVVDTSTAYLDWAETYDEPEPLIASEGRHLDDVLAGFQPGKAADIATGTGRIAAKLVALGHDTVGVDSSEAMLTRASANAPGARFLKGDLLDPPIDAGSMDLVTCGLALAHLQEIGPAIGSLARCLRPGGTLVITDIHPMAVACGRQAFFRRADGTRGVTRNEVHWPGAYIAASRQAGLTVERCVDVLMGEPLPAEFGLLDPEQALLGLPFASIWVMSR